jgi:protein-L-isoaspartate(D-aspartate) O-methyltransferase
VLSKLVKQVYSVERLRPLQERAKQVLRDLRINNVRYKYSDGSCGWEENQRKYDGILVTAAPTSLPTELLGQLKPGGRLVLPMGSPGKQMLVAVYQTAEGWMQEDIEPASFVPLLSGTR